MSSATRRLIEQIEAAGLEVNIPPLLIVPRPYVEDAGKKAEFIPEIRAFLRQSKVPEGSVLFCFEGYDDDPREIFQIGEICKFIVDLLTSEPELLRKFEISQRHLVRLAMSDQIHVVPVSARHQWMGATATEAWESLARAAGVDAEDCGTLTTKPQGPR